jgi:hypothetical protein
MTEREWLDGSNLRAMLHAVSGSNWGRFLYPLLRQQRQAAIQRKLRLFVCACFRDYEYEENRPIERVRWIEVAERYADGLATAGELRQARRQADAEADEYPPDFVERGVILAQEATTSVLDPEAVDRAILCGPDLLREIFGNPFRPMRIEPAWLAWQNGSVVRIAQEIYDTGQFAHLRILADALEDAGCGDEALLEHCRVKSTHYRGCWAVDCLLGKG